MLDDFIFGAATSAYQIEGAWNEDGKGHSIWDEIAHGKHKSPNGRPWKVSNNHMGDVACDHYHQWQNDVEIMKYLGLHAYRFSISWPRIFPTEKSKPNEKGIQFYVNLCDALMDAGIEPFVTLYHWDLPLWLDKVGGWGKHQSVDCFVKYADTMFDALTNKTKEPVKYFITINEPAVFLNNYWGHSNMPKAIKNVLFAHGKTVKLFNEKYKKHPNVKAYDGQIGISLNLHSYYPEIYNDKNDDIAVENAEKGHNRLWLDPIYFGKFPDNINALLGFKESILSLKRNECDIVKEPGDFLGINYYSAVTVRYNKWRSPSYFEMVRSDADTDEMGTEISPHGIYDLTSKVSEQYPVDKIYITENGCACTDTFVHSNHMLVRNNEQQARIYDIERIKYIREHLASCNLAVEEGVPIKGYFYWSLMDNFEWLQGYNRRFGLLYVFYPTQNRVQKDSFHWYRRIITSDEYRKEQLELFDQGR